MTDKCEHEHECYRGHLNEGDTFSIVATGVSPTEPNSLYVLCNGGYYDNKSNLKQRLYFSRDPYDYIPNIRKDSLNNIIVANLESQINDYEIIVKNDSLIKIELEKQINLKDDLIKVIEPKWYENKYLWFSYGAFIIWIIK